MLICCKEIDTGEKVQDNTNVDKDRFSSCISDVPAGGIEFAAARLTHPKELGQLHKGYVKHYYSAGSFNLIQLIFFVLLQVGKANIFLTTYSISSESIAALKRKVDRGDLLSARFIIDNRVRSISPKQFDQLVTSFPNAYRCCALHAKVALIWNDEWKISIIGSQNATHNPKLERGCIFVCDEVFDYDYKILTDVYNEGAT